ncbi:hypothetical protein F4780DRAFT_693700 [Xylariomycetidae sp. FL0641]|nr:hypothetical protein F4780DRAFT_693700 [Xylariomycetidae sp. FL0641]
MSPPKLESSCKLVIPGLGQAAIWTCLQCHKPVADHPPADKSFVSWDEKDALAMLEHQFCNNFKTLASAHARYLAKKHPELFKRHVFKCPVEAEVKQHKFLRSDIKRLLDQYVEWYLKARVKYDKELGRPRMTYDRGHALEVRLRKRLDKTCPVVNCLISWYKNNYEDCITGTGTVVHGPSKREKESKQKHQEWYRTTKSPGWHEWKRWMEKSLCDGRTFPPRPERKHLHIVMPLITRLSSNHRDMKGRIDKNPLDVCWDQGPKALRGIIRIHKGDIF